MSARPPIAAALSCFALTTTLLAQTPPTVPRMFWFTGVVRDASGQVRTGPTPLLFAIYTDADGGVPLAQELQTVTIDAEGRYGVLLGSTLPDGLPLAAFSTTEARWIGVRLPDGTELPRVMHADSICIPTCSDSPTLRRCRRRTSRESRTQARSRRRRVADETLTAKNQPGDRHKAFRLRDSDVDRR